MRKNELEERARARARVPDLIPYALLSACIYFLFSKLFLFQFAHSLYEVAASACFLHTHAENRKIKGAHARARTHTHTHTQTSSHIRMRIYLCAVVHPMTPLIARSTYVVGGWRWLCFGLDHLCSQGQERMLPWIGCTALPEKCSKSELNAK